MLRKSQSGENKNLRQIETKERKAWGVKLVFVRYWSCNTHKGRCSWNAKVNDFDFDWTETLHLPPDKQTGFCLLFESLFSPPLFVLLHFFN